MRWINPLIAMLVSSAACAQTVKPLDQHPGNVFVAGERVVDVTERLELERQLGRSIELENIAVDTLPWRSWLASACRIPSGMSDRCWSS